LKIAHFSWEFPPAIWGGLGTFATEITKKQARLGNKVTVFAVNYQNKLQTFDKYDGIDIYRPVTPNFSSNFYLFSNDDLRSWGTNFSYFADVINYNLFSASQLVDCLVRKNGKTFDIIDGHDWLGILGGIAAKKELKIPLIFHVHSTETGRSNGGGSKTIKSIELEGGKEADCIVTVSYTMKDELSNLGFPKDKIRVCWNGIDTEKYNPSNIPDEKITQLRRNYGVLEDQHLLFFIGRLVKVKGSENLVRAMPSVISEFPNTKLLILGVGGLEEKLRSLIKEFELTKNVIIKSEFVSEEERILHFAAADSVVLPSLYEPFGIVCTEAMAMEKPVIVGARDISGMREQVINNGSDQCGIHINPNDPSDIAWGIKQVLSSREKSEMMGRNARKRAIEQFSWDIITKRTLNIYKEFLT
jgi:glycogen(starch) synthase